MADFNNDGNTDRAEDAADMPARIMLLLITIGVFVAAWSSDEHRPTGQPHSQPGFQLPPEHQANERKSQTMHIPGSSNLSVVERLTRGYRAWRSQWDDTIARINRESSWTAIEDDAPPVAAAKPASLLPEEPTTTGIDATIPLPVDLAPGEYRIVNHLGEVRRRRFSPSELAARGIPFVVPRQNLYSVQASQSRWYFIRIDQPERLVRRNSSLESESPEDERIAKMRIQTRDYLRNAWIAYSRSLATSSRAIYFSVAERWQQSVERLSRMTNDMSSSKMGRWFKWPICLSSDKVPIKRL